MDFRYIHAFKPYLSFSKMAQKGSKMSKNLSTWFMDDPLWLKGNEMDIGQSSLLPFQKAGDELGNFVQKNTVNGIKLCRHKFCETNVIFL